MISERQEKEVRYLDRDPPYQRIVNPTIGGRLYLLTEFYFEILPILVSMKSVIARTPFAGFH